MTIRRVQRTAPVALVTLGLATAFVLSLWQASLTEIDNTASSLNFAVLPDFAPDNTPASIGASNPQTPLVSSWQNAPLPATPANFAAAWHVRLAGLAAVPPLPAAAFLLTTNYDTIRRRLEVRAFDYATGETRWVQPLVSERLNALTPGVTLLAFDGRSIYVPTLAEGYMWLNALDLTGQLVWKCRLAPVSHQMTICSSPKVVGSLVFITCEPPQSRSLIWSKSGFAAGVHRRSGELIWRIRKSAGPVALLPATQPDTTPAIVIMASAGQLQAISAATGHLLAKVAVPNSVPPAHLVAQDSIVLTQQQLNDSLSKKPTTQLAAFGLKVRAQDNGDSLVSLAPMWQASVNDSLPYPAMIKRAEVCLLSPSGLLSCLDLENGESRWTRQLSGTFSLAPVRLEDHLLAMNTEGIIQLISLADTTAVVRTAPLSESVLEQLAGLASAPISQRDELVLVGKAGLMVVPSPFKAGVLRPELTKPDLKPIANNPVIERVRQ